MKIYKLISIVFLILALAGFAYASPVAVGGVETTDGSYTVHTFTSSGTFNVTGSVLSVEYLIVAGGGAGGDVVGGGGGAGGLLHNYSSLSIGTHNLLVGSGGAIPDIAAGAGYNGGNSSIDSIIALGGGGGAGGGSPIGKNGGSGGGGTGYPDNTDNDPGNGTLGQGNRGGIGHQTGGFGGQYTSGGGGGSGFNGTDGIPATTVSGNGGNGTNYSISGSNIYYAGGGAGGAIFNGGALGIPGSGGGGQGARTTYASAGTNGLGGGGGGGGGNGGTYSFPDGAAGGSGVVIIRYLTNAANPCNETWRPCMSPQECTYTDMSFMFTGELNFNANVGNISGWNTTCVTNTQGMFAGSNFNQSINSWDVSNVIDMNGMFAGTMYNQPLSSWNTGKVTDMEGMFFSSPFNQTINAWDVSQVTNMNTMFAFNDYNLPLNSWNVGNVTTMVEMFGDSLFDQNIGMWDISKVIHMDTMFTLSTLNWTNYDALLVGWACHQTPQSGVTFDGGNSVYSQGALAARNTLTSVYGWTITDGGLNGVLPNIPYSCSSGPASINITIVNEVNQSAILDNVFITMINSLNSYALNTSTGVGVFTNIVPGTYLVSLTSAGYFPATYTLTVIGGQFFNPTVFLTARLLPNVTGMSVAITLEDNLLNIVPGARIIIARSYNNSWLSVSDTITDSNGVTIVSVDPTTFYQVTITSANYPTKQFIFQFLYPTQIFRLTTAQVSMQYTDLFNDISYYYAPTNGTLNNQSWTFTLSAISASSTLSLVSVNSSIAENIVTGSPASGTASITVDLTTYSGQSFPVKYCLKNTANNMYCFIINYWIGPPAPTNSLLSSMNSFRDSIGTDDLAKGWITLFAILGVLALCAIAASLSGGSIALTTIVGFFGLITFAYFGWVDAVITGFICVIGAVLFLFSRTGGS
jgi:hypothetical protein